MPELDEQIRRYVDAVAPRVRNDEIRTGPKSLQRAKFALIGALLVLVGVGAAFVVPMLRPSPSTIHGAAPFSPTWTRVPRDEAAFGGMYQQMLSVAAGGPGLVAVGWDQPGVDFDAAVWISPDGMTWTRVSNAGAALGGSGDQTMFSVAAGGPGMVAVGFDYSGGGADAAVWTSPDGTTWTRVPPDEAIFGGIGRQQMFSVAEIGRAHV